MPSLAAIALGLFGSALDLRTRTSWQSECVCSLFSSRIDFLSDPSSSNATAFAHPALSLYLESDYSVDRWPRSNRAEADRSNARALSIKGLYSLPGQSRYECSFMPERCVSVRDLVLSMWKCIDRNLVVAPMQLSSTRSLACRGQDRACETRCERIKLPDSRGKRTSRCCDVSLSADGKFGGSRAR